jgi:hypothetical protein
MSPGPNILSVIGTSMATGRKAGTWLFRGDPDLGNGGDRWAGGADRAVRRGSHCHQNGGGCLSSVAGVKGVSGSSLRGESGADQPAVNEMEAL